MHQGGVGNKGGRRDSLEAIKFVDELNELQVLVVDDYDRQDAKSSVDGILQSRKIKLANLSSIMRTQINC